MSKYFGTDGFRGEANVDLTAEHAFKIGRFIGWYLRPRAPREDSHRQGHPPLELYVRVRALRRAYELRADAYLLHVTTTPSVSYIARVDDFDCGVMISASHNPYHDNGIKLINAQGEKMGGERS